MNDKSKTYKQIDSDNDKNMLLHECDSFFKALCAHIGEDATRDGIKLTPSRMAKSFSAILNGYAQSPKAALGDTFFDDADGIYDEMIVLKKMPFYSMCEHHLLPFFGFLSVGYIPAKKLVGISGLARLAEVFTHRLQIQERLTGQIADSIYKELHPKGVMVVCEARHLCMEMRKSAQLSPIITSALRGRFKQDSKTRAEFMQLIQ